MQFSLKSIFVLIAMVAVGLGSYLFVEAQRPTEPSRHFINTLLDIGLMAIASVCFVVTCAAIQRDRGASVAVGMRLWPKWLLAFVIPWAVGLNMVVGVNYGTSATNDPVQTGPANAVRLWQDYLAIPDVGFSVLIMAEALWHLFLATIMGCLGMFACSRICRTQRGGKNND